MENFLQENIKIQWYRKTTWLWLFYPLSVLFTCLAKIRKIFYQSRAKRYTKAPLWIVGDITVGGSGKSPFLIWLGNHIVEKGISAVILSHGYKSNLTVAAKVCGPNDLAYECGDEAVMLAKNCSLPVVVGKSREASLEFINKNYSNTSLILCDDGLQDYKIIRDKEIVVFREDRVGNAKCFPVGPLREPLSRLSTVDLVVKNSSDSNSDMFLEPIALRHLSTNIMHDFTKIQSSKVHAVAGIADPDRFFTLLEGLGFNIIKHPFPDHYSFTEADLAFSDELPIILTTKDAVKCTSFEMSKTYQLEFRVKISARTQKIIDSFLESSQSYS
ncbi:MAG: tetraacyldisaccharide 4'-kinase [Pseudomonadota bacterium]|nr:tetraacyldisaccharide 4'-kinase [Pseudomonadota bacterium]